jgi:hypothetical protein
MGAELFHEDGQTDMTKLTVAFRNFANAPKTAALSIHVQICTRQMPRFNLGRSEKIRDFR